MQEEDEELSVLECPICFEQMVDIALPCSDVDDGGACTHSFCMGCMSDIYELSQNHGRFPQCPICRRQINNYVRNQLASFLVTHIDKMKIRMREIKDTLHERNVKLLSDNDTMAQRLAELEGELVKANNNNQGEAERNGHMRKMLHLMESEKTILSERLQELQKEVSTTARELEHTQQQCSELEHRVRSGQEDSRRARSELTQVNTLAERLKELLAEKEAEAQKIKEEKMRMEGKVEELEEDIQKSAEQLKKMRSDFERGQAKVEELEQLIVGKDAGLSSQAEEKKIVENKMRQMELRLQLTNNELTKKAEEADRLAKKLQESETSQRKSDTERASSSAVISQLEAMINNYKQEMQKLEEEKYGCGRKIAELEGTITKYKNNLRKSEEERNGYKERVWKAARDAEVFKKELEKMQIELKEKEDASKQSSYFSGFVKKTMNLNPLSAIWGDVKMGPLVRNFSDILIFERRGSKKDSCVWRGAYRSTSEVFAIKKIVENYQYQNQDPSTFREALILKKLEHPSITKLEGITVDKGFLYFLYSPFISMDLDYAVRAMKFNALQIKNIIFQLLVAVCYLHRQEIVHRNLKPTSVLVSDDCNIKLCGFSRTRSVLEDEHLDVDIATQSINYVAPEVALSESIEFTTECVDWKMADIWSVGCIFVELLMNGEPLFNGSNAQAYASSIFSILDCRPSDMSDLKQWGVGLYPSSESKTLSGVLSKSPHALHPSFSEAADLVKNMLKFDPTARPEASSLLNHKYFVGMLTAMDLSRGKDVAREVTDSCIAAFLVNYCAGIA